MCVLVQDLALRQTACYFLRSLFRLLSLLNDNFLTLILVLSIVASLVLSLAFVCLFDKGNQTVLSCFNMYINCAHQYKFILCLFFALSYKLVTESASSSQNPGMLYFPGFYPQPPPPPQQPQGTPLVPGRVNRGTSKDCGGTITAKEGWIFSPNYPANYDNSMVCTYTIERYSGDVCKVELLFQDFDLEDSSPGCTADYLDLGHGTRMCGILMPDTKKTMWFPNAQHSIQLTFKSNYEASRKGFMAQVKQIPNSCDPSQSPFPPNRDGRNEPIPPENFQGSCDTFLADYRGTFTSPNFPYKYPSNQLCVYVIRRPANHVCMVEINLKRFDIEEGSRGSRNKCEQDYLELPGRNRLCGFRNDKQILYYPAHSDYIILTFKSDGVGSGGGFEIDVRQLPNSCDFFEQRRNNKCDLKIQSVETRIRSPGFPGYYKSKEQCVYFVKKLSPDFCYFSMDFVRFDLEPSTDRKGYCSKDFIQLPDGSRVCGDVTGTKSFLFPKEDNQLPMFYFSADDYAERLGYDILVRQTKCGENRDKIALPSAPSAAPLPCDKLLSGDGVITSPEHPRDYPPFSRCIYTIYKSAPDVCEIKLQFLNLDVEKTSDCRADYLLIEATNEKLCGRDLDTPERVIRFEPTAAQIRLIFSTDGQVQRPGFEVKVTNVRDSCYKPPQYITDEGPTTKRVCEASSDKNIVLRSANYPMPYNPDTDCLYRVYRYNDDVCALEIYFSDFSVGTWESKHCVNDYFEIENVRHCGYRKGDRFTIAFPRYLGFINFRFKTDTYDHYGGFRIEIRQTSDNCNLPPKIAPKVPCDEIHTKSSFVLTSPFYGSRNYDNYTDCHYTIKKSSFDVCALEIVYKYFDVEESRNCDKDYLEISGVRVCGRLPYESKRTYEFPEDDMVIKFHTDSEKTGPGFSASVTQVRC